MQPEKVSPRGTANDYPQEMIAERFRFSATAGVAREDLDSAIDPLSSFPRKRESSFARTKALDSGFRFAAPE